VSNQAPKKCYLLATWLTRGPSRQIWVFKEQQNEIEISKKNEIEWGPLSLTWISPTYRAALCILLWPFWMPNPLNFRANPHPSKSKRCPEKKKLDRLFGDASTRCRVLEVFVPSCMPQTHLKQFFPIFSPNHLFWVIQYPKKSQIKHQFLYQIQRTCNLEA
jgi:hypothetical protein